MRKLLIVEDEWIIRKALLNLPWSEIGVELVVDAIDGREGLDKYNQHKPQVVLTDINMPFMTGLELGKILAANNETQIIFLTGYDEFSYAKEALTLKAFDYILKPVDSQVLLPQVEEAFKIVEEDLDVNTMKLLMKKQQLIGKLLFKDSVTSIDEYKHTFRLSQKYQCIFYQGKDHSIFNCCDVEFDTISLSDSLAVTLINFKSELEIENHVRWIKSRNFKDNIFTKVSAISFSKISSESDELPRLVKKTYNDMLKNNISEERGSHNNNTELITIEEEMIGYINAQSYVDLLKYIDKIIENIGVISYVDYFKSMVINQIVLLFEENSCLNQLDVLNWCRKITMKHTVFDILICYKELINLWANDICLKKNTEGVIQQAETFIDKNFSCDILSLQMVAEHVHVSAPYLSNLFKMETGKNYTEYVFQKRMEKACTMLESSSRSISEIATQIGFSNYNYFSSCFKKYSGKCPKDFRNSKKKNI